MNSDRRKEPDCEVKEFIIRAPPLVKNVLNNVLKNVFTLNSIYLYLLFNINI